MGLRRYERKAEDAAAEAAGDPRQFIPFEDAEATLALSALTPGARSLVLGLLRTGTTRRFPGGGIGIEYGSLLKTAVRPDLLGVHIREAADHLRGQRIDLLLVPGMSGYPVGAMYAYAAGIPAILLKKQKLSDGSEGGYPRGSFAIPSYTGDGDVVMSADLSAVDDIIAGIVERAIAAQAAEPRVSIAVRCAGADDIIDKATMAVAITECAPLMCGPAIDRAIADHRQRTGDSRPFETEIAFAAWVAPLIKRYNRPHELLRSRFGVDPFAGAEISSIHLDPPAIGIHGAGVFAFAGHQHQTDEEFACATNG